MLVVMQQGATEEQIQAVIDRLVETGLRCAPFHRRDPHACWAAWAARSDFDLAIFEVMDGREGSAPHRLAL